jgi:hypothetical protein
VPQQHHRERKLVSLLRGCRRSQTVAVAKSFLSLQISSSKAAPYSQTFSAASNGLGCSGPAKSFTLDTIDHKQQCCVIGTSQLKEQEEITFHQKGLCASKFVLARKYNVCYGELKYPEVMRGSWTSGVVDSSFSCAHIINKPIIFCAFTNIEFQNISKTVSYKHALHPNTYNINKGKFKTGYLVLLLKKLGTPV